jgi:general secretion pathway protein G
MIRRKTEALARSAFTLMEMLVVVAIIVVLAGASVPLYLNYLEGARRDRVKLDVRNLEQAVQAYAARHEGTFPNSLEELTQPDDSGGAALEQKALLDPWGQHYVYDPSDVNPITRKPVIYSPKTGREWR